MKRLRERRRILYVFHARVAVAKSLQSQNVAWYSCDVSSGDDIKRVIEAAAKANGSRIGIILSSRQLTSHRRLVVQRWCYSRSQIHGGLSFGSILVLNDTVGHRSCIEGDEYQLQWISVCHQSCRSVHASQRW